MIDLATDVRSEISALQWLPLEEIKKQYATYLPDFANCNSIETIRAVVIYRIQEKFYGLNLSDKKDRANARQGGRG